MNTKLEELIKKSWLSEKDAYEIRQIFMFVNDEKKQNILKNFYLMVENIKKIKIDLLKEQEILLWRTISNIERSIKKAKIVWYNNITLEKLNDLKQTL